MTAPTGAQPPDRRTAGLMLGGVAVLLLGTGMVNSVGGLDAFSGANAPAGGRVEAPPDPGAAPPGHRAGDNSSLAVQLVESGVALSVAQQRLVATVSRAYPRFAEQGGRVISLGDLVCRRLEQGSPRPLVAAALVEDGMPSRAAAYIIRVSIQHRCPGKAGSPRADARWSR